MSREFRLFRRILANDLRLFLRGSGGPAARFGTLAVLIPGLAFFHLPAYFVMASVERLGGRGGAEFAALLTAGLLLSVAFQRSLETLYNRGDLPFLLASPAPRGVVVATRLVDIALTTLGGSALFFIPLLDCAVLRHGTRWLWGWPAWFAATALFVPLALAATLALVRRFGARRTRVLVQLLGIALGVATFIGFQASNWLAQPGAHPRGAGGWLHWFAVPPLTQLADAARGAPLPLSGLVGAAILAVWWSSRRLAREFAHGALAAGDDLGGVHSAAPVGTEVWQNRFRQPRWRTIVLKELRLVFRDPLLLARASTQIITIVPALAGAFLYRATVGLAGVALVGPAMAAALLAALMTANDEAPECAAVSPLSRPRAVLARAAAAAFLPALLGWVIATVVLALGHPGLALITAAGATLNAGATAWLTACTVRPHTPEERARNKQPMVLPQTLFGLLVGGLGSGAVGLVVSGRTLAAVVLLALATLAACAGFLARPRRHWAHV